MEKSLSDKTIKKFIPHIPAFIDVVPPPDEQFNTVNELMRLNFVKRFSGYALSLDKNYLIGVSENGNLWRVIGFIDNVEGLDIPQWKAYEIPNPVITI